MKKLLTAAAIAAVFVLPAHAAKKPVALKPQVVNTKAALAKAKDSIAWRLKDPESVRWRQAKVASNGNVCIEVNAKNSYGGYTGFQLYHYNARENRMFDNEFGFASAFCRERRLAMPNAASVNAR